MVDGEFITLEITAMDINQTELHDVNYAGRVIISIYFILVAIFGFFGNLIILVVLVKIPKMRSHTNIFIGSLAVSDLTTCLMLPFLAAGILSKTGWPMPNWMCIINAIVRFTSQGSSVWNLVAIAVNRLVLVTMSARLYRVLYQTSTIIVNIAFVWLFPLSCVIIPYLTGDIVIGFDKGPNICSDTDFDSNGNPAHTFVYIQGLVLSCIPLVIVVVCYIRIYVFVRLHIRRQNKTATSMMSMVARRPTRPEPSSMTSSELKTESETNDGKTAKKSQIGGLKSRLKKISLRRNYSQLESRITKNCFYVFLGFLICIIPYGICILADIGFDGAPLAMIFLVSSTCLNPIIYGTKHPLFKSAMWNILTARFSRDSNIPDASAFHSATRQNENGTTTPVSLSCERTLDNSQDLAV
ncbi:melatonin receptor type 1A-like [Lytechinus pictus]|uniref:melatonin receptor type 1A-like n=1 Tax=Lytechinus pictus TaxID=7653 RepID=UPI0030B9FED5